MEAKGGESFRKHREIQEILIEKAFQLATGDLFKGCFSGLMRMGKLHFSERRIRGEEIETEAKLLFSKSLMGSGSVKTRY